ncbi:MAG: hypothetical protein KAG53_10505 [Endozoicomonadaceae bacterium]|nr:hypothetical protein [Endozoicomonadaceae bacterium]
MESTKVTPDNSIKSGAGIALDNSKTAIPSDESLTISQKNSQTSSTSILTRAIKYCAAVLGGIVMIPACALVESVTFLCLSTVVVYINVVQSTYHKNRLLGVIGSVTFVPLGALAIGIFTGGMRVFVGACDGVSMACGSPKHFIESMTTDVVELFSKTNDDDDL